MVKAFFVYSNNFGLNNYKINCKEIIDLNVFVYEIMQFLWGWVKRFYILYVY